MKQDLLQKSVFCILFLCILIYFKYCVLLNLKIRKNSFHEDSSLFQINNLSFIISNYQLYYSDKYNFTKICYEIQALDINNNSILPSDLTLYYNLHIICLININNTVIYSLPQIEENTYFRCIEFSKLNEELKIGILIYKTRKNDFIKKKYKPYLIDKNIIKYKSQIDDIFDSPKINYNYTFMLSLLRNNNSPIKLKKLKKLYISKPICTLKRNVSKGNNRWHFINLFNEYFCFCRGLQCLNVLLYSGKCKYFFYLYIIDINQNVYEKNDFLLLDFILKKYSDDDVYPIFEKMINRNLNAHYLTEKKQLYDKYCHNNKYCNSIILLNKHNYRINHQFLEMHLTLILKLKQVISSVGININFINNLFYNIDYITYICVGHGVSYFKYYLYRKYYGPQNFDKLLIPNSERLISMTIKYGWKRENLIKFNLPRWEKYNYANEFSNGFRKINSNSIFIMFTWREFKFGRYISLNYIHNILSLINNDQLINKLLKYNQTLYFTLHHKVLKYRKKFKIKDHIKYISENEIAECLSKTNMVVTDYSSIIFDMIYRRKPYIIYIPDANDSKIKTNYRERCYNVIKNFKDNDFKFENVFFDIDLTIDKINYYIENQFKLEPKLIKFYNEFNFTKNNIINDFIDYILKL